MSVPERYVMRNVQFTRLNTFVDQILLIERLFNIVTELKEMTGVPKDDRLRDKNVQKTDATDPNKRVKPTLSSNEVRRTKEIATLFAQTFIAYQKKSKADKQGETLIKRVQRQTRPPQLPQQNDKKGGSGISMFLGLVALIGGAAALIYGLFQGGPLAGIMKIISKIGITGGLKMIVSGVKVFIEHISKILKFPLKVLSTIGNFFKKMFGGIVSKIIPSGMKGLGKSTIGKMLGGIGKVLLKVIRRIPLVGSIISIAFAVSRFMKGDVVGGVIDTLSALSGLLYLVPGGQPFGFAISLGLDVLNAWLDVKAEEGKEKGVTKMDILKDMFSKIGAWLKPKVKYIPILRSLFDLGDAYNAFKSGNILEGFKYLGVGIMSFVGINSLIDGVGFLTDMFSGKGKEEQPNQTKSISWVSKIRDWVKGKLQSLPLLLRKPLEWMGFVEGDGEVIGDYIMNTAADYGDKINEFVGGIWDSLMKIGENVVDGVIAISENIIEAFKTNLPKITEIISNVLSSVGNYIKNLFNFTRGNSEELTNEQKSEKARAAGWNTWDEYEKSGWQYKSNNQSPKMIVSDSSSNHLNDIAKTHFKYMHQMVKYNDAIYKVLLQISKSGLGGNNISVNNTPTISPQQSSALPNIASFGDNRSGYANSDYAFA
jgi:hypothetical protein